MSVSKRRGQQGEPPQKEFWERALKKFGEWTTRKGARDKYGRLSTKTLTFFGRHIGELLFLEKELGQLGGDVSSINSLLVGTGLYYAMPFFGDQDLEELGISPSMRRLQTTHHLELGSVFDRVNQQRREQDKKPFDWSIDVAEKNKKVAEIARDQEVVLLNNSLLLVYGDSYPGEEIERYFDEFIPGARRRNMDYPPSKLLSKLEEHRSPRFKEPWTGDDDFFKDEKELNYKFEAVNVPQRYRDSTHFIRANIERLDLPPESYDVVFFQMGGDYLKHMERTFGRIVAATKMGGLIITDEVELEREGLAREGSSGCRELGLEKVKRISILFPEADNTPICYRRVKPAEVDLQKIKKGGLHGDLAYP
ncbi:methyltransferase domain-containing protein [Candidatus Altiarchaeota archaeon]